jgi:phage baseplate assembly protein gpV
MGVSFEMSAALGDTSEPDDRRINGVCPALVVSNMDLLTEGRIQVQVPWLPGFFLWARVAVPMAGTMRGTFFIPQVGDEVLVAFAQGDVREAYVIGSLWSTTDRPPALTPIDPTVKRVIRTPLGQEVEFDETLGKVTITNLTRHTITMSPTGIELSTVGGTAKLTLGIDGTVSITGTQSIALTSFDVAVTGVTGASVSGGTLSLDGGANCTITGATVNIN